MKKLFSAAMVLQEDNDSFVSSITLTETTNECFQLRTVIEEPSGIKENSIALRRGHMPILKKIIDQAIDHIKVNS